MIHKLKDRLIEIIYSVEQNDNKWRKMNRASDPFEHHQSYQNVQNGSHIRRRGRERESYTKIFGSILDKNFKNFIKNIPLHIQKG